MSSLSDKERGDRWFPTLQQPNLKLHLAKCDCAMSRRFEIKRLFGVQRDLPPSQIDL